ncbi:MAG: gamma-butyrobetaine hydroxylase-like domain-containing protein [Thermogutta sp.]
MASPHPLELALEGRDLIITWNDGQRKRYAPQRLRALCPCAGCNEARRHAAPPLPLDAPLVGIPETVAFRIVEPVGNYAYKIGFNDGHDTGIYTLERLHQWGETA